MNKINKGAPSYNANSGYYSLGARVVGVVVNNGMVETIVQVNPVTILADRVATVFVRLAWLYET